MEDAATVASYGDDGGGESSRGGGREEDLPPAPSLLSERDLEKSVYLTLHETETIFIWQAAGEMCANSALGMGMKLQPHRGRWLGFVRDQIGRDPHEVETKPQQPLCTCHEITLS